MVVGSIYVDPGRHDIGLNLKRNNQYQLSEYVRKVEGREGIAINYRLKLFL